MYQGYLVTGAYRKTKWWIDIFNIILGLFIIGAFVLSLFIPFFEEWRYVLIFVAGAAMNGITGIKKLLEHMWGGGAALVAAAVFLGVLAVLCLPAL